MSNKNIGKSAPWGEDFSMEQPRKNYVKLGRDTDLYSSLYTSIWTGDHRHSGACHFPNDVGVVTSMIKLLTKLRDDLYEEASEPDWAQED